MHTFKQSQAQQNKKTAQTKEKAEFFRKEKENGKKGKPYYNKCYANSEYYYYAFEISLEKRKVFCVILEIREIVVQIFLDFIKNQTSNK
jgi:hypothetical protein